MEITKVKMSLNSVLFFTLLGSSNVFFCNMIFFKMNF